MRPLLALVFLAGCQLDKKPGQDRATDIVWLGRYQEHHHNPPDTAWRDQDSLDCAEVGGQNTGFHLGSYWQDPHHNGDCVLGVTWEYLGLSEVAWYDGAKFSTTAYAHEMYHIYLVKETGDPDADHLKPDWGIRYGYAKGIVDEANEDLARQGF